MSWLPPSATKLSDCEDDNNTTVWYRTCAHPQSSIHSRLTYTVFIFLAMRASKRSGRRFGMLRITICLLSFALALTGTRTHAFITITSHLHRTRRIHHYAPVPTFRMTAAGDNSNKARVTKKRQSPPEKASPFRFKKKYDKLTAQAIALNKQLIRCDSSDQILDLLASTPNALTKMAGGGALNSVNYSTALHRMARYSGKERKRTLTDPRFALFLSSLCEAMAGMDYTRPLSDWQQLTPNNNNNHHHHDQKISFGSRESCNIAWAIAKLRLAPPLSVLPVSETSLVPTSLQLRQEVLLARRRREEEKDYVKTLSLLAGRLLDLISNTTLQSTTVFNAQHQANLLWALSTAQRAQPNVFARITSSLIHTLQTEEAPNPQECSNSLWAYATAKISNEGQEILLEYVASTLTPEFMAQFKSQEASNTAWSVATILTNKKERTEREDSLVLQILRQVAFAIAERADAFKPQELSNTVWAFATVGFGLDETYSLNDYIYLRSDDVEGDRQLMSTALDAVAQSAVHRLHTFRSQELNNLAWAFARLGRTECTDLYAGIGHELSQQRRLVTGQDIGTTLWAFATLEYFDQDVYRAIVSRLTLDSAYTFRPQELSNLCWALATAGVEVKYPDAFDTTLVPKHLRPSAWKDDPVTICFEAAASELMRRPQEFKAQEIKDISWSCSKAKVRHPTLFKSIAEHLVGRESDLVPEGKLHCGRGLDEFSPQGIGNLLWSYAKQAQLAAETVDRVEGLRSDTSGRLFIFVTICIDIGEALIKRLFHACAEADMTNHDNLAKLSFQDLSNTCWSLAAISLRHTRFFETTSRQVVQRLSRDNARGFKGMEISNIVWACATLNLRLPELLDAITPYMCQLCQQEDGRFTARSIANHFKRIELANISWSCAVMGHYPPELMHLLYTGLVGGGEDPDTLAKIFGDGGLQRQAIMSLLYVQMAVDMESPDKDLTLPANFPDGWDDVGDSAALENPLETVSMLSLSTSKIQKDVSAALNRVGFPHVEEHVIAMEELARNHGIQLSSKSFEILSIDIANVESRVGIEVDGPGHFVSELDNWSPQEKTEGYTKMLNGKLEYQFQWDGRQEMNGSTALKDRLLLRLGWKIMHIPFWEWYAINGDTAKEDEYCKKLLEGSGYR